MSIECFLLNGKFVHQEQKDFATIEASLDSEVLYNAPIDLIVDFLSRYAKALIRQALQEEGVIYLATWMRASNLKHYLKVNLQDQQFLDHFVPVGASLQLRAQARGVVCHWIAGNIPTLGVFSLVQSILCKNRNILRIPQESIRGIVHLLRILESVEAKKDGKILRGKDVLRTLSLVYFPSSNNKCNQDFSLIADCKVVWGGKEAVKAVLGLPQREHCESVVFGPKYSFAVVDEESISPECCQKMAMDIITFEQQACSSPHVIFCETKGKQGSTKKQLISELAEALRQISVKHPKFKGSYTNVLNARGIYWLDPEKEICCSEELDWTILSNNTLCLEEPVGYRTIFVKEIPAVFDVMPLITSKIQTVGIALQDEDKKINFCEQATAAGVSRCVPMGEMNTYQTPWDGILFLNRLVRWTSMYT